MVAAGDAAAILIVKLSVGLAAARALSGEACVAEEAEERERVEAAAERRGERQLLPAPQPRDAVAKLV